jgi:SpoU rRNA methylase family enzyme
MLVKLVLGFGLAAVAVPGAQASVAPDRGARQLVRVAAQRSGDVVPIREVENRIKPMMGDATYLGFLWDPVTNIYTLKFLRNGSVIWVDVDARTGRIVRRSGR